MARQTTNYGFNISEGTDLVNPLTDIFPNFEDIDTDLKGVSDSAVGTATELLTGTVHALVRSDSDRNVFTFTATSNFEAGETFTLDGVQVTALTPDGQTLSTGCYIIGSEVLVAVKGTLMTVYVTPSKALDSDKLDGHDSTYYATASDVSDLSGNVSALSSKVGTGTLTVGNDCVDGINTLNGRLTQLFTFENIQISTGYFTSAVKLLDSRAYREGNHVRIEAYFDLVTSLPYTVPLFYIDSRLAPKTKSSLIVGSIDMNGTQRISVTGRLDPAEYYVFNQTTTANLKPGSYYVSIDYSLLA